MKNVLFDMETGDPDDLVTLLMLLLNPEVNLRAVTCWEGSEVQVGLISHVLEMAGAAIPVGGLNSTHKPLNDYYARVVGPWESRPAVATPVEVLSQTLMQYPDTHVLTGAALTNIAAALTKCHIENMTSQGGYVGAMAHVVLDKFRGRSEVRTYNMGQDTKAFDVVNNSAQIDDLTYVTKDLCHGFIYTPETHRQIEFKTDDVSSLLKRCLADYADNGRSKAMHDPLAMIYMLHPNIGHREGVKMSYRMKTHPVFSSVPDSASCRYALVGYDQTLAWEHFRRIAEKIENIPVAISAFKS